ncbi:hypothetical protein DK926_12960 [Rhodococcus sp. Eu-32]|uniref:hypothetical protein n=1 Tax=Rhodococcus sp. Eu-32 TaxID=1017319 RepID=UPI000DF14EE0|nr:hypothetical protein [Rhodococcus sp. Eu-32]RRQ27396.1 hypothetical protein DK926_12960 [Rhodococcus sp. Eu-32]
MIDRRLEHFLLYEMSDDWMPVGAFASLIRRITPDAYSRRQILDVISEIAARGHLRFGGWAMETSKTWEPWAVPHDVAMSRIANGFKGSVGVLNATDKELATTEVFRADLTDAGFARLSELGGDPYEIYGDPWEGDPLMAAEGDFPPWEH